MLLAAHMLIRRDIFLSLVLSGERPLRFALSTVRLKLRT